MNQSMTARPWGTRFMASGPSALAGRECIVVVIDHPEVVAKSYPGFWRDLMKIV